jgi:hypothetical protein
LEGDGGIPDIIFPLAHGYLVKPDAARSAACASAINGTTSTPMGEFLPRCRKLRIAAVGRIVDTLPGLGLPGLCVEREGE